ncbi:maestro heat-like repeat-containing protein family member 7 [Platysternon megacephalum]|uniref:Maestro heat-like repeat-containing protein family member 7 n=1 Tax=Platysternon megacephalum TaxID=55544 RepID=A0A4D9EP52_9SAUR|nr:maestro heat-like repeat-containing protein family member 7 [Platysternon megacephalum]
MNSRATDNLVNKVYKSIVFLKLKMCFYIWVSNDLQLFIKTNKSVQHSLVGETKQIALLGPLQCHTFLSLSSILITQCCTLQEESCLVTTVHFSLNSLDVLFSVAIFQLIQPLKDDQAINPLAPTGRTLIHICSLHVENQDLSIKSRA